MSDSTSEIKTQLTVSVDSQELTSMNLCKERWKMEMVEHWRPNYKSVSMEKGSIMHAMLAHYYRNRADRIDKDGKLHPARLKPEEQNPLIQECLDLGKLMAAVVPYITPQVWEETIARVFKEYILWYQADRWEVLSVEKPFTVVLYETPRLLINYTGVMDLVVIDPKLGMIVVDHKTEARESKDEMMLSNQFQGYTFASGRPVVINKIGWQKESKPIRERFRRIECHYNEEVMREWQSDTIRQVIESIGWMKDIDDGKRMMKNRGSCDKFGGCTFKPICIEPPEVREHKLIVDFHKKPWDPHKRDEVAALEAQFELDG